VKRPHSIALVTVLAPMTWGTTYLTITETLPSGRPLLVALVRVLPAGLILMAVGQSRSRWRPHGPQWWQTSLQGLLNFGIFFPLLAAAVYRLPGGVAAAFGGLQPLFVAVLSWVVTRQQPIRRDIVIGFIAAIGVSLVALRPHAHFNAVGLLAAFGANLSFAAGVVGTKRFGAPSNRLASTGTQLLFGGLVLLPVTLAFEGLPSSLTGRSILGFAYLSLIGTAVAFMLWFDGIRRLPQAAPPLLGLAAPITGATLGWVVLHQSLTPIQVLGFAITIGAIAYGATTASNT
jgi:probable blue pigment (indigoidine) exporter